MNKEVNLKGFLSLSNYLLGDYVGYQVGPGFLMGWRSMGEGVIRPSLEKECILQPIC